MRRVHCKGLTVQVVDKMPSSAILITHGPGKEAAKKPMTVQVLLGAPTVTQTMTETGWKMKISMSYELTTGRFEGSLIKGF